jgi:hypothetical protein
MAKHLNDKDIDRIVELVDGWRGQLTWEALCDACKPAIGSRPTRQTLCKYTRIAHAFRECKARVKEQRERDTGPSDVTAALQRLERLENENARLKRENRELLEQFVVWQYNAYARGLSDVDLNRPLPSIDRDSTNTV